MNTFIWVGVIILLLGWIGLLIIALSYKFEEDRPGSLDPQSLPKTNSDNPSEASTPK